MKKALLLSIESLLFNRDPLMVHYNPYNPYITGGISSPYSPKQPGALFRGSNVLAIFGVGVLYKHLTCPSAIDPCIGVSLRHALEGHERAVFLRLADVDLAGFLSTSASAPCSFSSFFCFTPEAFWHHRIHRMTWICRRNRICHLRIALCWRSCSSTLSWSLWSTRIRWLLWGRLLEACMETQR